MKLSATLLNKKAIQARKDIINRELLKAAELGEFGMIFDDVPNDLAIELRRKGFKVVENDSTWTISWESK